ncbi:hypothetical protein MNQ98_00830 [Paenibacillus sp. N3/727]|uniref:hypothetical protein n=1 Tax=Paenibacillus sp. N3/727 TaxID=2925845 RepID=UPI001F53C63F|nr:hypothetical protein [Paenibacillus sp. N3/727]UNK18626.1 hypothetical protein MNQ98_00830 [Paenibacillus sp. N3/727]
MSIYMKKNKHLLIVLAPLIIGWLFNMLIFYLPFSGVLIWTLNLGFVLFWFWVGSQFAQLSMKKVYSYLLGNMLWLISFLLYVWQFILLDEASRSIALAGLSQYYMLLTIIIGTQIHMMYSGDINSTEIVIISYMVMLLVFTMGFIYQSVKGKKKSS